MATATTMDEWCRARDNECVRLSTTGLPLLTRLNLAAENLRLAGMPRPTAVSAPHRSTRVRLTAGGDKAITFDDALATIDRALEALVDLIPSAAEWSHLERLGAAKLLRRLATDTTIAASVANAKGDVVLLSLWPGENPIVRATRLLSAKDARFRRLPWSDRVREASKWLRENQTV